jgi:hypothetical protein
MSQGKPGRYQLCLQEHQLLRAFVRGRMLGWLEMKICMPCVLMASIIVFMCLPCYKSIRQHLDANLGRSGGKSL